MVREIQVAGFDNRERRPQAQDSGCPLEAENVRTQIFSKSNVALLTT